MSILERVPVPYARKTTLADTIRDVYEHVRGKAFEYYVERGELDGYDLEDWLRAERALIVKPDVTIRRFDEDVVIEIAMPDVDGGLIGGASLKADEFLKICAAAKIH